jgi:dTDP-4-dehydrorhamnose 3,5-epimerase
MLEPIKLNSGAVVFDLWYFDDHRGQNFEGYNEKDKIWLPDGVSFVRDCYSKSRKRTLRGLHGDGQTWKLIQCLYGEITFVVFNYENLTTAEIPLSSSYPQQVLIPPNCVNGHYCESKECVFSYKMSTYQNEFPQFTIKYNDEILKNKIDWNGHFNSTNLILSDRDRYGPFKRFGHWEQNT